MKKKSLLYFLTVIFIISFLVLFTAMLFTNHNSSKAKEKKNTSISGINISELSEQQITSLYKLCKVWGMTKYYHPTVVKGKIDWDKELFKIIPKVLIAKNQNETNNTIYEWINSFPFKTTPYSKEALQWEEIQNTYGGISLDMSWIKDKNELGSDLSSYLQKLSSTRISERKNSYAYFEKYTVNFKNEKDYTYSPEDDGLKLLSLFRFWNIYEYYSPYVDQTNINWDNVLLKSIPKIISSKDYTDYVLNIANIISETKDAHIRIFDKNNSIVEYYGQYLLPICYKVIDGQVVVSSTTNTLKKQGLKIGDIITEINNTTIEERIQTLSKYSVLPDDNKFEYALTLRLLRSKSPTATVKVIRDNKEFTLQLSDNDFTKWPNTTIYDNNIIENTNIGYIDFGKLTEGEIEKLLNKYINTDGIILDLRQYPTIEGTLELIAEYLLPEMKVVYKLGCCNQSMPGTYFNTSRIIGAGYLNLLGDTTKYPLYTGKVIILMDGYSISQCETMIMALRQSANVTVIGSDSCGANGEMVKFILPGSIEVNGISSTFILTPEGEMIQRKGIKPDIECHPTVKGLQEGRDELIEEAIKNIQSNNK